MAACFQLIVRVAHGHTDHEVNPDARCRQHQESRRQAMVEREP